MKLIRNNKKTGSLLDIFPIIIVAFFMVIMVVVGYMVWSKINASGMFTSNTEANNAMQNVGHAISMYDSLGLFVVIMMSIVVIILASQVYTEPAYFFIGLFVLVIAFVVAVGFSGAYGAFELVGGVVDYAAEFPKLSFLMAQFPIYVLVMMFGTMLSMYVGYKIQ